MVGEAKERVTRTLVGGEIVHLAKTPEGKWKIESCESDHGLGHMQLDWPSGVRHKGLPLSWEELSFETSESAELYVQDQIKPKTKVFIDTNVLLEFFRFSDDDLDEIRKVVRLWRAERITPLVSSFGKDEFHRNRETVIADAIATFKNSRVELHRPYLIRLHAESEELEKLKSRFESLKDQIVKKVVVEGLACQTKADTVISELFEASEEYELSEKSMSEGLRRAQLGKPPGKHNSCGDAIHWEWLLRVVKTGEDLCLVTRDRDYASQLDKGRLSSYLEQEWKNLKKSNCYLYTSLTDFLRDRFPGFRLSDEDKKLKAIEEFVSSSNSATARNAITCLASLEDFSRPEIGRLISAIPNNLQVEQLHDDREVIKFVIRIADLAHNYGWRDSAYLIYEKLGLVEPYEEST